MSRPVLTCLNIKEDGSIEASDAYRAIRYTLKEKMPVSTFLLPASATRELSRLKIVEISMGEGWAHFRDEHDTIFSCRIFAESFPDVASVLNMTDSTELKLPDDIGGILERAAIFAKQEISFDETVTVIAKGQKLSINSEMAGGWFTEWGKIEGNQTDFSFRINPAFLQDALRHLTNCSISTQKIAFFGKNWTHIIALRTAPVGKE